MNEAAIPPPVDLDLKPLVKLYEELKPMGITLSWLRAEANAGRLPCIAMGSRKLFSVSAIKGELLARARRLNG